jgi:hypothetical protein
MGLTFENNQAFFRKIKNFGKETEEIVKEELQVSIDEIYNAALIKAPADMGGGGGIRGSAYKEIAGLTGEVGFKNKYAAYVEFGTGAEVSKGFAREYGTPPEGLPTYAMEFFVNGKGRLPARPFLFPAWFKESGEFMKRIKDAMEREWVK